MAINRSSFFERLDKSPASFNQVEYAEANRQGSSAWRVYAVNDFSQHLFIDFEQTKAAAGAAAGRYRRWLEEYNNDRY